MRVLAALSGVRRGLLPGLVQDGLDVVEMETTPRGELRRSQPSRSTLLMFVNPAPAPRAEGRR